MSGIDIILNAVEIMVFVIYQILLIFSYIVIGLKNLVVFFIHYGSIAQDFVTRHPLRFFGYMLLFMFSVQLIEILYDKYMRRKNLSIQDDITMRDLETLDFDVVTVSCSMRLRSHLEPYLSNKKYLVPNLDSSGLKTKEELMDDHKAKIRKSDAILVLHDGKIGESVTEEIEYARYLCKPVFFLKVA